MQIAVEKLRSRNAYQEDTVIYAPTNRAAHHNSPRLSNIIQYQLSWESTGNILVKIEKKLEFNSKVGFRGFKMMDLMNPKSSRGSRFCPEP